MNGVGLAQTGRYYVEVESLAGCENIDSIDVSVRAKPVVSSAVAGAILCKGDNVQLSVSGGDSYKWTPAAGLSMSNVSDPVASPGDTTIYQVIAYNEFGCTDTAEVIINVAERPMADAGPDKYILDIRSVQLLGKASGQDISYSWTPNIFIDNANTLEPVVSPPADTSYVFRVESNLGCGFATDTVRVYVLNDIFVPGAFSPNGDGLNDTWTIPGLNALTEYEISVFNRGGQLVYYTRNSPKPWNGSYRGQPLPAGAYVYMIDLKNKRGMLKGPVILVR
jgi:gliding motility-associated-like protein